MSTTRGKIAAAAASAGVLVIGWQIGTANGQTVDRSAVTTPAPGTTEPAPRPGAQDAGQPAEGRQPGGFESGRRRGGHGDWQGGTDDRPTAPEAPDAGDQQGTSTGQSALEVPASASGTFTGTAATHRFGSVTVTVTLSGGQITALSEQVVDDGDRKSQMINQRSIPVLKAAILAANGDSVSAVSSATYTTRAYLTSLQSALDQAR